MYEPNASPDSDVQFRVRLLSTVTDVLDLRVIADELVRDWLLSTTCSTRSDREVVDERLMGKMTSGIASQGWVERGQRERTVCVNPSATAISSVRAPQNYITGAVFGFIVKPWRICTRQGRDC